MSGRKKLPVERAVPEPQIEKERKAIYVVEIGYFGKASHEANLFANVTSEMKLQFGGERVKVRRLPKPKKVVAKKVAPKKISNGRPDRDWETHDAHGRKRAVKKAAPKKKG